MHFLEIFALRSLTVIPMFVLGFTEATMHAYIFLVYVYSTFVHANLGWRLRLFEKLLVTPRFHHWHHRSSHRPSMSILRFILRCSTDYLERITSQKNRGQVVMEYQGIRSQQDTSRNSNTLS